MVLRTGTLTLAFFLLMTAATRLGPMTLAAHQIMLQLWLVTSFAVDGFALTASSLGARLLGQGSLELHRILCRRLLVFGGLGGALFSLAYALTQNSLPRVFTPDPELHRLLAELWWLLILTQPLNGLLYVWDGIFFGLQRFDQLRRRMLEGFILVFLPLLLYGYWGAASLSYLWYALWGLSLYRLGGAFFSQGHRLLAKA